jgi:hypothetical protein
MHGGGADDLRHVLCATEMHAGNHAYFSHDLVYSRGFGLGKPRGLPVRTAAQASANFPGGFPLRPIDGSRFEFSVPDPEALRSSGQVFAGRWMVLSDGGVFDNLADAWHLEASDRAERLEAVLSTRLSMEEERAIGRYRWSDKVPDHLAERVESRREEFKEVHADSFDRIEAIRKVPDCLVVVNAGTSVPWHRVVSAWVPLLGEVLGFVKITHVMYNNLTTQRVRDLRVRFANEQPAGAVVDMAENPGDLWDSADRGITLQEFRDKLRLDDESDRDFDTFEKSRRVRTTLLPLGVETTAHLLYHGYVQTRAILYARLGYDPIHSRAAFDDFCSLARGEPRVPPADVTPVC